MEDIIEQSTVQTLTLSIASFERCISELIANSLNAHAAAIAVRIHAGKREIQIVDNGVGIPNNMLKRIAEYDAEVASNQQQVLPELKYLANARRLSDRLTIASRYQHSKETFMKEFKMGFAPNLKQIEQRPLHGTTVSIHGFHEIPPRKKWNISTICFLIAAIAVTKLKVSFSIRDEERKKVVLRIAKPHSPVEVLKTLFGKDMPLNRVWSIKCSPKCSANFHGYVGLSDRNAMQWIFLNHRPICCPLVLKLIKIAFKERLNSFSDQKFNARDSGENIFILFFLTFSEKEFTFVTENGKRCIMFYNMQKILNAIKNCIFKCLAEEATVSSIIPYLYKTQLLKQIYLKREKSVFSNDINKHQNITSSMIEKKIVLIGFKRKRTTSTNYLNKQCKINDNIETVKHYVSKRHNALTNIHCQTDVTATKRTNLCVDKDIKTIHSIDKMQESSMNLDITDDSGKSNKVLNCHENNNLVNTISPLSEWSNWTYYTNNKKHDFTRNMNNIFRKNEIPHFDFLPRKLYGFLQHRYVKLTNLKSLNSPNDTILFTENWQHEQTTVHPCKLKQKLCEFKLSRESLKCIKIINQVNNEFIAAWMTYNDKKILLMIDQHAVHERIRYEKLLLSHKVQNESELLSFNLRDPLSMEFPTEICNLLLRNKISLMKYGISLGSLKENTLLIRTIPQCLVTNSDPYNNKKILPKIHSLLNDVLKNRNVMSQTNTLPLTIHNAIASGACHGAIKFGDKLTLEQCKRLIKLLKHTQFPNRCAHGRPTIIPVMEFSELGKRNVKKYEEKLNFASLKKTTLLE